MSSNAAVQSLVEEMIRTKNWTALRQAFAKLDAADIAEILQEVSEEVDAVVFRLLDREKAAQVFAALPFDYEERLLSTLVGPPLKHLVNDLSPDDRDQLLRELPPQVTRRVLQLLSREELKAARDLLGYPPEAAGRYMTPEYVPLTAEMTANEAIDYIRKHGKDKETLNVLYVVDEKGHLLRDVELGVLVRAEPETPIMQLEERPLVALNARDDREEAVQAFSKYDRVALPVVDESGQMLGIITHDDMLDVYEQEATEDIHKLGGIEALEHPYMSTNMWLMLRKRGGILTVLFLGGLLTASVLTRFEGLLESAIFLAVFIPLVVSSGGNSGSQAATLITRALALREVRLKDWWRVLRREVITGALLGLWLGAFGFARVAVWHQMGWRDYGENHLLIALTVFSSIVGIVLSGCLMGSMLPFILERIGLDPATSSTPFVATLVDVSGVLLYLAFAMFFLSDTLL